MTINQVRKIDAQLAQSAESAHLQIPDAMKGTPFEQTSSVLTSLVKSLDSLKAGILDLAEAGNHYGTCVLFRVFLEHILKTNAIFLKTLNDGSDDFAEQYLQLRVTEAFEYLRAHEAAELDIGDSPKSVLDQWFPEAQSLSANAVRQLADPFRYRNLIQTIRDLVGTEAPDFLSKIIPNYSELSGFVHGGPTARTVVDVFHTADLSAGELYRVADLTVSMFYSAKRWLFMLASGLCPEFQQHHDRLDEALNAIHGNETSEEPTDEST